MGLSRDTFYRYREAVEDGGVEALLDKNRRRPNLISNNKLGNFSWLRGARLHLDLQQ